ncbi:MAG: Smr/MutS family protein [Chitinophagales bacterium]
MPIDKEKLELLKAMMSGDYDPVAENKLHNSTVSNDLHRNNDKLKQKDIPTLEDQLKQFEKIIDKALLSNQDKVSIIHGKGAGILKKELYKRLKKTPQVKRFELNAKNEGETIVYFK